MLKVILFLCLVLSSFGEELFTAERHLTEDEYKVVFKKSLVGIDMDWWKNAKFSYFYYRVDRVYPGGWAERSGIKVGDIIDKINDFRIVRNYDMKFITDPLKTEPMPIVVFHKDWEKKIYKIAPADIKSMRLAAIFNPVKMAADEIEDYQQLWVADLMVAVKNYRSNLKVAETALAYALSNGAPKNGMVIFMLAEINKYNLNFKKALKLYKLLFNNKTMLRSLAMERFISLDVSAGGTGGKESLALEGKTDFYVNFEYIKLLHKRYLEIKKTDMLDPAKTHNSKDLIQATKGKLMKNLSKRTFVNTIKNYQTFAAIIRDGIYNSYRFDKPVQNGEFSFILTLRPSDQRKSNSAKSAAFNFIDTKAKGFDPSIYKTGLPAKSCSLLLLPGRWLVNGPEPSFNFIIRNEEIMKTQINVVHMKVFNGLLHCMIDDKTLLSFPMLNIERAIVPTFKVVGSYIMVEKIKYNEFESRKKQTQNVVTQENLKKAVARIKSGTPNDRTKSKDLIFSWSSNEWKKLVKLLDRNDPEQKLLMQMLNKKIRKSKSFVKQTPY